MPVCMSMDEPWPFSDTDPPAACQPQGPVANQVRDPDLVGCRRSHSQRSLIEAGTEG